MNSWCFFCLSLLIFFSRLRTRTTPALGAGVATSGRGSAGPGRPHLGSAGAAGRGMKVVPSPARPPPPDDAQPPRDA